MIFHDPQNAGLHAREGSGFGIFKSPPAALHGNRFSKPFQQQSSKLQAGVYFTSEHNICPAVLDNHVEHPVPIGSPIPKLSKLRKTQRNTRCERATGHQSEQTAPARTKQCQKSAKGLTFDSCLIQKNTYENRREPITVVQSLEWSGREPCLLQQV